MKAFRIGNTIKQQFSNSQKTEPVVKDDTEIPVPADPFRNLRPKKHDVFACAANRACTGSKCACSCHQK